MDPYRTIAPFYDACTEALLRAPRRLMVEVCVRAGARRLLDMGCGTGALAAMARERADQVVGLDRSAFMLAAGSRKRAAESSRRAADRPENGSGGRNDAGGTVSARLAFVRGDAAYPPFAPGSFDALLYSLMLHETEADALHLLDTGFRLAPLAVILEWRMPERNLDVLATSWVHVVERLAGRGHYARFRAFMRDGGVRGLARRAGADILSERALAGNSLVLAVLRRA